MRRMRGVGWVVVAVVALGAAGCGSNGDSGGGGDKSSVSAKPSAMGVQEALDAYTAAASPGCETAPECQDLVTAKLKAAVDVRAAMKAKDAARFEEPIGFVNLAEERADHYGRDNLGAKGNSFAVSQPLQQMVAWFREHPGA
ncbi:DUF3164 family protein (plasmid) [Streptomyces sp. NBC_00873]|uniref:hypothetical protein n=1 Tax=Streptomyces sp. NBC_00873 TaxID=2975852 RepID=UPI00386D0D56|nr:DUF3164 family protein [Streptomyces sp. NBC_00873]